MKLIRKLKFSTKINDFCRNFYQIQKTEEVYLTPENA